MNILETPEALSRFRAGQVSQSLALVPTMGNLHEGHLALIRAARARAERVVVSIFVNPTQFGPSEDFERYPRTVEQDLAKLHSCQVDAVFLPTVEAMYPGRAQGMEQTTLRVPEELANQLCGAARPGHFDGVATVVCKLFGMARPDLAFFGRKDYQQLIVLKRMVADLNLPVQVIGLPTVREPDGLAMSSRNGYLDERERQLAPRLQATLRQARDRILQAHAAARCPDPVEIEQYGRKQLLEAGFVPDYFAVRTIETLGSPSSDPLKWILLAAARLGQTRLIDNLAIHQPELED